MAAGNRFQGFVRRAAPGGDRRAPDPPDPELIEYVSTFMTLEPDGLILTGTSKGVSHVYPGDVMRMEIDGIGVLENPVVEEEREAAPSP